MKQYITYEQMKQLEKDDLDKYCKLIVTKWKPKVRDIVWCMEYVGRHFDTQIEAVKGDTLWFSNVTSAKIDNCVPLFSIGQMIEILHISPKGRSLLVQIFLHLRGIDGIAFNETDRGQGWENDVDLCDSLWKAVIEIL